MSRVSDYHSFMVRLWREGGEGWRATAQSTATARVYQFSSVEALFAFLRSEMAKGREDGDGAAGSAAPSTSKHEDEIKKGD